MAENTNATWEEQGSAPSTPSTGLWKIYPKTDELWYALDDTGAENQFEFKRTGSIFVPAGQWWPSTTGGAAAVAQREYTTNDVDVNVIGFDAASDEFAQTTMICPNDFGGGTFTAYVYWTNTGGGAAETVRWVLQARAYADDGALDQAWGSGVNIDDTWIAQNDLHVTAVSGAITAAGSPAANQLLQWRIYRDTSEDDLTGDADLIGVQFLYTKS